MIEVYSIGDAWYYQYSLYGEEKWNDGDLVINMSLSYFRKENILTGKYITYSPPEKADFQFRMILSSEKGYYGKYSSAHFNTYFDIGDRDGLEVFYIDDKVSPY